MVSYVNEGKRKAERSQKILDLVQAIENGESLALVTPTRTLEMEQNIEVIIKKGKTKKEPRKCILFNDAVLLLKEGTKKGGKFYNTPTFMGLGDIKVVNVSDCTEFWHGLELQVLKTKETVVLIFPSEKDKTRWLKIIKAIVKQYQRMKFEEMTKAEDAKVNTPPPSPVGSDIGGAAMRRTTSAPSIQAPKRPVSVMVPAHSGDKSSSSPKPATIGRNPLLRRLSFHSSKVPSVTSAPVTAPPAAVPNLQTPPDVRYSSKPVIKQTK